MKRFLIIPLLFIAFALSAAPITERQARDLATHFFQDAAPTRAAMAAVELVFAGDNIAANAKQTASVDGESESLIYIYNRSDAKGFVVIAGEDTMRPVIAFSFNNTFNIDNLAVGTRHMLASWCKQVAAARARQGGKSTYSADALRSEIGTPICQYQTAQWGQSYPFNALAPVIDGTRSVTGCVATATAIVFRYHQYPQKGKGTTERYSYQRENGQTISIEPNTLGSTYNYANMPLSYAGGCTTTQADAVARLMYDIGTAVKMNFDPEGSGALTNDQFAAVTKYFGYNKETAQLVYPSNYANTAAWIEAMKENLKTYGPTPFSGVSYEGGHAFVLDGVTSSNYFSINWGWEGHNNGYFLLPEIEFFGYQDAIIGLKPDPTGESEYKPLIELYPANAGSTYLIGITSDYYMYKQGQTFDNVLIGAIMNYSQADFTGYIALAHCDKDGKVKRELAKLSQSPISIPKGSYLPHVVSLTFTIEDPIEVGDRLRLIYWSDSIENAKWARRGNADGVVDEIIMRAAPETIAEMLSFTYDKATLQLQFNSELPLALNGTLKETGQQVIETAILKSLPNSSKIQTDAFVGRGEMVLSFTCGDQPYEMTVTF